MIIKRSEGTIDYIYKDKESGWKDVEKPEKKDEEPVVEEEKGRKRIVNNDSWGRNENTTV